MSAYSEVRDQIRPGDVIAFAGKGGFSSLIKKFTGSPLSHVGVVMIAEDTGRPGDRRVLLIESTTLERDKTPGVHICRLSDRLIAYDGSVWWCPLSDSARERFDASNFENECWKYEGAWYNSRAILDFGFRAAFKHWFDAGDKAVICSQLATLALQAARVLPLTIEAHEVSPAALASFAIYRNAVQLVGEPAKIGITFNTKDPRADYPPMPRSVCPAPKPPRP